MCSLCNQIFNFIFLAPKKKKKLESKKIRSQIKTTVKSKNSKRKLAKRKKNQREMKIKNKVNVERTFIRER